MELDDLLLVDCAGCRRELLSERHYEHRRLLCVPVVAGWVRRSGHDRPMCHECYKAATYKPNREVTR